MKFLKRVDATDFIQNRVIGADGGTVPDVPLEPNTGLEIEIDGKRYVLLAYEPKV